VDLRGAFANGQTYTAISRAVSLEGLALAKPLELKHIKTSAAVKKFLGDI
jgi:ATP-dependent exoDNAse (exonuclease V) alpha subunit